MATSLPANSLMDSPSEGEEDFEDCLEELAIVPTEDVNINETDSRTAIKPLEETKSEEEDPLARCIPPSHNSVMIWTLEEALQHQVEQIGVSACGATAVINVLSALGIPCNPDVVDQAVDTRLREEEAPLPQYLFSRSVAGTVHQDLIKGMSAVTDSRVVGRFFDFHPDREVNLVQWLGHWMEKGAVPIATMNMQQGVPLGEPIPDAWHHQMIFGIGPEGVHMVNPLITEKLELFHHHICSESVLLIRQADVVTRCSGADLNLLERGGDPRWSNRWQDMRVAEQCMEMMMETLLAYKGDIQPAQMTRTHVRIPAAYRSGITLFMKRDTPEYLEMLDSPGLALKQMQIRA
ncbi:uncharacterized protein LOC118417032 isoform X1 [Branchiostoma floridae]|uniref:Uncharacterized protein LOC118417032 isoform X1 n=1 Tax=Branchiostoma floridae TaxID=7739 RepID=A0A9J7L8M5_BRAFL|nr:uncharacterized protein LOC118417032 isoform X1 [Branchiostoma floridae]XP_035678277.1 uncharacterized protein LOC118417032 isoform X1 [Branchiostoma floridae]XP_035678278.1 uncharacterized protein LOC118417032 isoform X1 [Branchiostoma floridae]XP_035678279.1 uncharacterized protein LOC118417032 isoform X1 [Branchiostoma floridae]XP_035678280.1 uncharacterized protein LOC118417032 isoform X1 [Branchiostoma floridae]